MLFSFLLWIFLLGSQPHQVFSAHCATATATKTFERCVTLPTQQASIAWTYHRHNSTLDLCFFGTFISPSGWVGWGINPRSPEMTGTRALLAFPDPNSGQLVLLPYILDPTVKLQKSPLLSRPLDIRIVTSSAILYGGKMASIRDGATVQIYASLKLASNKTEIHHVWNRGLYVQGYSPTIHPTTSTDLSSFATFDVASGLTSNRLLAQHTLTNALKIVHGIVNTLAWGVLIPAGVLIARYLRHFQAAGPAWFYTHAGVQLSAFVIGTVGFSIGIKLGDLSPGVSFGIHRRLGFTVWCLGAVQTVALLFRPKTTNRYRKYWKSYHHFVGYACMVIGVVNVFQGFEAAGEGGSYSKLAYSLWLSTLVGVCVAMEVNSWVLFCRKAKEEKMRREGFMDGGPTEKVSSILN